LLHGVVSFGSVFGRRSVRLAAVGDVQDLGSGEAEVAQHAIVEAPQLLALAPRLLAFDDPVGEPRDETEEPGDEGVCAGGLAEATDPESACVHEEPPFCRLVGGDKRNDASA
jgi:hypothetical protein